MVVGVMTLTLFILDYYIVLVALLHYLTIMHRFLFHFFSSLYLKVVVVPPSPPELVIRCESGCSKKEQCFAIRQWFICPHYQCVNTTVAVSGCIQCGEKTYRIALRDIPIEEIYPST